MSKLSQNQNLHDIDEETLNELIADEAGAREPTNQSIVGLISLVAFLWAMFQLFVASSLPYILGFGLFDDTEQRVIHLSFALFLGFLLYPAFKKSPRKYIPWYDWILAFLAISCTMYLVVFYEDISSRVGGIRSTADIVFSVAGLAVVLEITRRTIGLPLVIIAGIFMAYALFGSYMPEIISHRGVSVNRLMEHLWLTTEGVFGLPLGVSASFIFLFVLFGALLEKAGAGNFFIQLSFSLLGHMRGGPAKAAVVSSGLTGLISGSAIANVATTGVFTIPLMKRIGFSAEKAAAIEVSASINGQIMPPVMGAAAFLMTEFVGISYFEVIKHAFLPAIISYIGLFYIVHLEAEKMNLPILERVQQSTFLRRVFVTLTSVISIMILSLGIYYGVNFIKSIFAEQTVYICTVILVLAYVFLLWVAAKYPEIKIDDPNAPLVSIPRTMPILMAGLYYLIPIAVLIWGLMIERFSPSNAVIWAILVLVIIMVTQHPMLNYFRKFHQGEKPSDSTFVRGVIELYEGIIAGSRNMIGIALAMGAAGIIVGVVSLTGVGLMVTEIIDTLSGGNVLIMLILTAIMCVVLGMGLPTTANYIVVASVMAQPFVTLAAQHGLIVPLIAINLFVFYFGLISGTTPPVAVDAYAGAAVAGARPMQTAINSFFYNIRTSILPFIFIFNPGLLLIGMEHWYEYAIVIISSILAMMVFCASTKGFFITHSYKWESALLLLIAFTLIRPGYWLDQISPPFKSVSPDKIYSVINQLPDDAHIRLSVSGENFSGDQVEKLVLLPLAKKSATGGEERLYEASGLRFEKDGDGYFVTDLKMNSPAMRASIDYDWKVKEMKMPTKRMAKEWFYIPAFLLLVMVFFLQRRRKANAVV